LIKYVPIASCSDGNGAQKSVGGGSLTLESSSGRANSSEPFHLIFIEWGYKNNLIQDRKNKKEGFG
jgi:hypothetical protein